MDKQYQPTLTEVQDWVLKLYNTCDQTLTKADRLEQHKYAVMVQRLDRLSHDITILYRILRFLQNYSAVLITTETNLQYELYLTGLESRILARTARTGKRVPWEVAVDAD